MEHPNTAMMMASSSCEHFPTRFPLSAAFPSIHIYLIMNSNINNTLQSTTTEENVPSATTDENTGQVKISALTRQLNNQIARGTDGEVGDA